MESELNGSVSLLVAYGAFALLVSFLCSIAEAVLLSTQPSFIETLREARPRGTALLARLKADIDRPLAAILTLNTIAHTAGAVGVGAEAGAIWGSTGVGVASGLMTVLILVLSEIIPKTIGAVYWRPLSIPTAYTVDFLIRVFVPFVWLSKVTTRLLARPDAQDPVTREEIAAVAEMSKESGELRSVENRILKNLLKLHALTVNDIMTPRTVIIAAPEEQSVSEFLDLHSELPVSRIPIYTESIDRITGFALKSDILLAQASGERDVQLVDLRRELNVIPATASLSVLFERFMERRDHLALVVDEYGGTDGLVSMEDLMETLLGIEIVDEADVAEDMQRLAREHWAKRAEALGLRERAGLR